MTLEVIEGYWRLILFLASERFRDFLYVLLLNHLIPTLTYVL